MKRSVRWAAIALAVALGGCSDSLVGGRCAEGWEPAEQGCIPITPQGDGGADAADASGGDAQRDAVGRDADAADAGDGGDATVRDGAVSDGSDATAGDGASDAIAIEAGDGGATDGDDGGSDGSAGFDASDDATSDDATSDDATTEAGAQDAGVDAQGSDATTGTDAGTDAAADAGSDAAADAGPLCMDPLVDCNGECVDTNTDPSNCGACGVVCATGVCNAGVCRDARAGHIVLIGHSYEVTRRDENRVLGNAVFLSPSPSPRVLVYQELADLAPAGAVANADAAITTTAGARTWTRSVLTDPMHVSDTLSIDAYDVVLVYEQLNATDAQIATLASEMGDALASFALAGGVVIVLDGPKNNGGTYPIANATGFLNVTGVTPATRQTVTLVAPADALAVGVSAAYRGERTTVSFVTSDPYAVFAYMGAPVVLHRAVLR